MVSVQIITNQGIIQHTENAANLYEQKQDNELEQLNLVEQELNQYATGSNTESNNWWEITEEERSQMKILINGNTYLMVTSNKVGFILDDEELPVVLCVNGENNFGGTGDEGWMFALTDVGETALKTIDSSSVKHQWYYTTDMANYTGWTEYNGESPISKEDFTEEIYCESYLDRIIASFN